MNRQRESTAVKNQITSNIADAAHTQLAQQQPELFLRQTRITAAAQIQIPVGIAQRLGFPGVRRTEQLQRGVGCHQLHRRRRIHCLPRIVADQRLLPVDALNDDTDTPLRDPGLFERGKHLRRQFRPLQRPGCHQQHSCQDAARHATDLADLSHIPSRPIVMMIR